MKRDELEARGGHGYSPRDAQRDGRPIAVCPTCNKPTTDLQAHRRAHADEAEEEE